MAEAEETVIMIEGAAVCRPPDNYVDLCMGLRYQDVTE